MTEIADNVTLDVGAGGDTIATEDIAGVEYQKVKLVSGTATSTAPIPAGGGTEATALRVTVATDSTGVLSVDDNGGSLTVDAPVGTPAFVRLSDGAAAITALPVTDNAGSLTVDGTFWQATQPVSGTFWQATQPVSGTFWQATQPVSGTVTANATLTPATTGGLTIGPGSNVKLLSAASTNATSVKASAGQVYGWYIYNANAAVRYMKLYNKASAPTVGTDVPTMVIPIPPGAAANVEFSMGIAFGTGIALALTTGVADADTGAVAANELVINLFFK